MSWILILNQMQVGENGLGKEAFIKNTFASYCQDDDLPVNVCDPSTTIHDFRHSPEDFCTEVVVDVDEGRTKIHYNMQVCSQLSIFFNLISD